jgi:hypothetical protein
LVPNLKENIIKYSIQYLQNLLNSYFFILNSYGNGAVWLLGYKSKKGERGQVENQVTKQKFE